MTEILRPSPYCDAQSRCDDIKTIKPIINEAFVASNGDIITDYNDFTVFLRVSVVSCRVNIIMSAFVIGETTNNKSYSTQIKTRILFNHLCCGARGAVGGSVSCSRAPRRGIEGGESAVHSLPPPTIPSGPETRIRNLLGDESDSLTIRPRLSDAKVEIAPLYRNSLCAQLAL